MVPVPVAAVRTVTVSSSPVPARETGTLGRFGSSALMVRISLSVATESGLNNSATVQLPPAAIVGSAIPQGLEPPLTLRL